MEYITNEEYRKREGVSSSVLKTLLVSEAHYAFIEKNGWKRSDAMTLGDAIHARALEPERFKSMYELKPELYKRAVGEKKAGDPKTDKKGNPIFTLVHSSDPELNITGEQLAKFNAMVEALGQSKEAAEILKNAKNIERSFFLPYKDGLTLKVRCDCTYGDYIVDLKTVGGIREKPSAPENFCNNFFDLKYDVQMYMYYNVIKRFLPNIKGFMFLCVDATNPSGVNIYKFTPEESTWFELGGYRFKTAIEIYKHYISTKDHFMYKEVCHDDLQLSYNAEKLLLEYRDV